MDEYETQGGYNSPDLVTSSRPKKCAETESYQNSQGISDEQIGRQSVVIFLSLHYIFKLRVLKASTVLCIY